MAYFWHIARLVLACIERVRMMTSSAEDCWRLSRDCGRWAAETRDGTARLAFRQMSTAWGRLAYSEEFTAPVEQIDSLSAEDSNATIKDPSSPPPVGKRDWTSPRERLSLRSGALLKHVQRRLSGLGVKREAP